MNCLNLYYIISLMQLEIRASLLKKFKIPYLPESKYSTLTDTPCTRLLLEVLLEAGLVSELAEAVGALERHALAAAAAATGAAVRRLHVVVQEALLGEVLQAEGKLRKIISSSSIKNEQLLV